MDPIQILKYENCFQSLYFTNFNLGEAYEAVSLAMALSIPATSAFLENIGMIMRDLFIIITYSVVLFSILIQGTTIETMIRKSKRNNFAKTRLYKG